MPRYLDGRAQARKKRASTSRPDAFSSESTRTISDPQKSSKSSVPEIELSPSSFRSPAQSTFFSFSVYSLLLGNPAKAEKKLGWKRTVDFESLVREMVQADLSAAKNLVEDRN